MIVWRCLGLLVLLSLTSCGFHLKGMDDAPPWLNDIAIITPDMAKATPQSLTNILKDQLAAYKIRVINPSIASYILNIEDEHFTQEMTNVGASTAPRQYLLSYHLTFNLATVRSNTIKPLPKLAVSERHIEAAPVKSGHIVVTRQVTINNDRILGSDAEEALLKQEMRLEAVIQLINRLRSYAH